MKKMGFRLLPAVLVMATLSSCYWLYETASLSDASTRAMVPTAEVAVYGTADKVPGKYEEVELLDPAREPGWTGQDKIKNLRWKAGQVGANAIIIDALSEPRAGAHVATAIPRNGEERRGRAVAIYVVPSPAQKK